MCKKLDQLEKMVKKKPKKITLKVIEGNKELSKAFGEFCKKEISYENWDFYLKTKKKVKPEKLYNDAIQLNIDSKPMKQWKKCENKDLWKEKECGKELIKLTMKDVKDNLGDTISRFRSSKEAKKILSGGQDPTPLRNEIKEDIEEYENRISKVKNAIPGFPEKVSAQLQKSLTKIDRRVDKLAPGR